MSSEDSSACMLGGYSIAIWRAPISSCRGDSTSLVILTSPRLIKEDSPTLKPERPIMLVRRCGGISPTIAKATFGPLDVLSMKWPVWNRPLEARIWKAYIGMFKEVYMIGFRAAIPGISRLLLGSAFKRTQSWGQVAHNYCLTPL